MIDIHLCESGQADTLSLLGQATFLESFAGLLHGDDIVAHCRKAHALDVYQQWLDDPQVRIWMASCSPGAAPIGYVVLSPRKLSVPAGLDEDHPLAESCEDDLEVQRIYVLSRFQGGGTGGRLLAAAIAQGRASGARHLWLGVNQHNASALAFYEKHGFRRMGTRRFSIGQHDYDDFVLRRSLLG